MSARLQQPTALLGAEPDGVGAVIEGLLVGVDDQLRADRGAELVPERDHFAELVLRVDVQERKRDAARKEGLLGDPHHDGGVLADRVEHDGILKFRRYFPNDMNAFRFEEVEMIHWNNSYFELLTL